MKKAILTVLVLAVSCLTLAGCISKPPHKMLSDPWLAEEVATYEVTRNIRGEDGQYIPDKAIKGESIITTKRVNKETISIGDIAIDGFSGTTVTIETTMDDGSTMKASVAFKTTLEPVASYKHINVKGYEFNSPAKDIEQSFTLKYVDKACEYVSVLDGVQTSGSASLKEWKKAPFYDNLMIYHVARSSYLEGKFTNISVPVFSTSDNVMKTMSMAKKTAIKLQLESKDENDKGIACDMINISLNQDFPGSGAPLVAMISTEAVEGYAGLNLSTKRHLLAFTEGDMNYIIKSITEKSL